jgi:hypothetical protein
MEITNRIHLPTYIVTHFYMFRLFDNYLYFDIMQI